MKLFRKIRIGASLVFLMLITGYFLDFAGLLPLHFKFVADIQLIPALLSINALVLIALLFVTLGWGRVYCSSICPMGVYQDVVAWCARQVAKVQRKKGKKYAYTAEKRRLRWGIAVLTAVTFLFGTTLPLGLLDPYSAYGRIVTHLFRPVYLAGNNMLNGIFSGFDNHTFYEVGIYGLGFFSFVVALITMLGVGFLAWSNGRTYCNTICPVGTILGFLSRFSLFKVRFVEEKCNSCGLCAKNCKAACINSDRMSVDYSRCVNCFNCTAICNRSAMKYTVPKRSSRRNTRNPSPSVDESKRRFMAATAITGLSATYLLAEKATGTMLRRTAKRQHPIMPPGALNVRNLHTKCVSCHLCVSKCPSHVIRPSFLEYGLSGIMQPMLYFEHGFCNYDCTVCGDVCPTGALIPLSKAKKHTTQAGRVHLIIENCIVYTDETNCGACSEHCPTQAVHMEPYKDALTIPHIEPEICVGCGGCEYVCPAEPHKAIYVEGVSEQRNIELRFDKQKTYQIDDFGF